MLYQTLRWHGPNFAEQTFAKLHGGKPGRTGIPILSTFRSYIHSLTTGTRSRTLLLLQKCTKSILQQRARRKYKFSLYQTSRRQTYTKLHGGMDQSLRRQAFTKLHGGTEHTSRASLIQTLFFLKTFLTLCQQTSRDTSRYVGRRWSRGDQSTCGNAQSRKWRRPRETRRPRIRTRGRTPIFFWDLGPRRPSTNKKLQGHTNNPIFYPLLFFLRVGGMVATWQNTLEKSKAQDGLKAPHYY